jgi:putative tryptophan/tyrosine transport system substrate-binding protein
VVRARKARFSSRLSSVVVVLLFVAPLAVEAQPARIPRVGVLSPTTTDNPLMKAFEQGLSEQGYVADKTIRLETRHTAGRGDRLLDFAVELANAKVDVIAVWSSAGALAAQQATWTIPIVFVSVTAPEKIGLVQSVVRPGGNITGVAFTSTEATYGKTLEILKEAVPTARRVTVLLGQTNPVTMQAIESAVRGLKITVEPHIATEPEHLDAALAAIRRSTVDAMYVPPSGLAYQHRKKIVDFSASSRLPTIYPFREAVDDGGLLSFGASQVGMARQAASFVVRILKGARPGELPVEQPTTYELLINLKTAKALNLTLPRLLLLRADQVIE